MTTTEHDLRYIQQRGTTYRVRFPQSIWPKRWFGTYTKLSEAQEARDAHLMAQGIAPISSTPNKSELSYADIVIPGNAHTKRLDDENILTIPHANALVFGDLHTPHHNVDMIRRAIFVTRKFFPWIEDVILHGDTWDFTSISRHPKDQPPEDLTKAINLGGDIIRTVCNHFSHAWFTNGNHDARVGLKLDAPWTLEHTISAALGRNWPQHCQMHITNFDYVLMNSEDGDPLKNWMVGHPAHYSGQGGKTPADIADLEQRNVATGHNHLVGMSQSKSGRFCGVDVGHSTDPDFHYYVKRKMTKYARWNAGFLVISGGYPYHFTERWTDWSRWGCE